jgi:cytochrome c553
MVMTSRTALPAAACLAAVNLKAAPAPPASLTALIASHCTECHGPDQQKAGLRLDTLGTDLHDETVLGQWQAIGDQLRRGDMPPPSRTRPSREEVATVLADLQPHLDEAYASALEQPASPVIRRLNRIELRNTLRDLLGLEQPMFRNPGIPKPEDANGDGSVSRHSDDPIREFPADESEHGFDTVGSRLVMSDFFLRLVMGAAEQCLDLATVSGPPPERKTMVFTAPIRRDGPAGLEGLARPFLRDCDVLMERYREPGAASNVGRLAPGAIAGKGVGTSAPWRIRIEASAHHQHHPWGELIRSRQDEPMILGLHLINSRRGAYNEGNPDTLMLAQWPIPDDGQRHEFQFDAWIDAAWLPWLGWENAPHERGLTPEKLVAKYRPEAHRTPPPGDAPEATRNQYQQEMAYALFSRGYDGPHLRIHRLTLEPLPMSRPPQGHALIYGQHGTEPIADVLTAFATKAWRAPVDATSIARFTTLAETEIARGVDRAAALRTACTAILASPRFCYLQRPARPDHYQIASQLSYFLWSSMPDDELRGLAAAERLSDPTVRRAQVERMLHDPRAASFIRRFPERWLRLDRLGSMPPPGGFYFHRQMEEQLRRQIDAYFADLVQRNGPVRDLVDSDYTFLNERTAQWIYQREDVWGDAFRRVPARPPHGGGLLTMPALMTATANGVDTSPVVRGVWMLESVLGLPPKPPPLNIEPLSPDLRGARTIREQLEAHRAQASCQTCHRKIDPLGFAFENFDELGLWRTHYRGGDQPKPIDPTSVLSDGRPIADLAAMKQYLVGEEEQIARRLTMSLLTYAAGRQLTPRDRGETERILRAVQPTGYRLRDLIHEVAASRIVIGIP